MTDEWKPIETAPKDDRYILLYIAKSNSRDTQHRARKMHVGFWNVKRNHWGCGNDRFFPVTHWMPLPTPPRKEE